MHSVAKVVQDKIGPNVGQKICYSMDSAVNTISLNKDATQAVVAGRNVFKILVIEEDQFVERANLRVGKNINLNYSAADVDWNHTDEHILASAATNGAVVIWNLNKASKSKQEHVFLDHKRAVNRVCFHKNESNLLLSGAQDGCMNLFDVRVKSVATQFGGKSESVRDVSFSPFQYFNFVAAYDNGNVQLWDLRKPDKFEWDFTAHGGPVFTLDWHPEDRNWLATAGRDKTIKVWDLLKLRPMYNIQTIAPVACVRWRPQRKFHLASCSLLIDCSINVWDIRRPYIPFATFDDHKDVVSGIVWKYDPRVFLSCGRDNLVYQHMFRDARRPAEHAIPAGLDINIHGDVSFALCDKANHSGTKASGNKLSSLFKKAPDRSEQFSQQVLSNLFVCPKDGQEVEPWLESLSMNWFVQSAQRYMVSGRPIQELCDHNAAVCQSLGRHQVAQTWKTVKLFFATTSLHVNTSSSSASTSVTGTGHNSAHTNRTSSISTPQSSDKQQDADKGKPTLESNAINAKNTDPDIKDGTTSGGTDDESDAENSEVEHNLTNLVTGLANQTGDFFFGDGETDSVTYNYQLDPLASLETGGAQDWTLPSEAFQPRHEICDRSTPPEQLENGLDSPGNANESDLSNQDPLGQEELMQTPPWLSVVPGWKFTSLIVDMLKYHAEEGDVQTSVSVLLVLGDHIRTDIDILVQENWFTSYIDLLGRFKLYTIANTVIKRSGLDEINSLNQRSTRVPTNCSQCSKPLTKVGWKCERCKSLTNNCSVCHLPVRGLYVWCQGCIHGGHMQHIQDWFTSRRHCPTGCGHMCEYT